MGPRNTRPSSATMHASSSSHHRQPKVDCQYPALDWVRSETGVKMPIRLAQCIAIDMARVYMWLGWTGTRGSCIPQPAPPECVVCWPGAQCNPRTIAPHRT